MILDQRPLGFVGGLGRIRGGHQARRVHRAQPMTEIGPVDARAKNTSGGRLRSSGDGANHQTGFASVDGDSIGNQARRGVGRIVGERYRRSASTKLARAVEIACGWKQERIAAEPLGQNCAGWNALSLEQDSVDGGAIDRKGDGFTHVFIARSFKSKREEIDWR